MLGSLDRAERRFPATLPTFVRGRSPGSEVLTRRLPRISPSGSLARPHFLTVAGAAQAFHLFPVSPDGFNSFGHVGTADSTKYSSAIAAVLPRRHLILGFTLTQDAYCLTTQEFSKKLPCMDGDVSSLERKLDQFLAHFNELREANRTLRERVDGLEDEKQALTEKIESARLRLEALMDRLPE